MLGYAVLLGPPRFSDVIKRMRVIRLIGLAADRPVALVAPSGYGKTVAAAQLAENQSLPVIWVSVGGQPAEYERVLVSIHDVLEHDSECAESALRGASTAETEGRCRALVADRCPAGVLVVLDDVGRSCEQDSFMLADRVLVGLRHSRTRIIMTTRQDCPDDWEGQVVNYQILRLSQEETRSVAALLGRTDLSQAAVDEIGNVGVGHPALTTSLLAAANEGETRLIPSEAALVAARVAAHLPLEEQRLLGVLRFLGRATLGQLARLGFANPAARLAHIAASIPLVQVVNRSDGGDAIALAHDLLRETAQAPPVGRFLREHGLDLPATLDVLNENGATSQLRLAFEDSSVAPTAADWLMARSDAAICSLGHEAVLRLIELLPLNLMVGRPRLMLSWAIALMDIGQIEEALDKARVAYRLASEDQSGESLVKSAAMVVNALSLTGRAQEAWEVGDGYLRELNRHASSWMTCDLLAAMARAAAIAGKPVDFARIEEQAKDLAKRDPYRTKEAMRRIDRAKSTLMVVTHNDWRSAATVLGGLLATDKQVNPAESLMIRGNLAFCLAETGRLSRATGLLASTIGKGTASIDGSYLPALAMVQAAEGESSIAIENGMLGIGIAVSLGDEMDAHMSRISLASIVRASGRLAESLETAERAYEGLSRLQVAGCRELAATEVAASLLAMNDTSAARNWILLAGVDHGQSSYRSLRASLVLAECDRRDDESTLGIERLRQHGDEIQSENSNWQMAMYVRTFPHLLGMLSNAVGPKHLPVHMLRMILPEHAEPALRAAESLMESGDWAILGRRLLGEDQFEEFLQRKGRPMCRVRLFGGLEVCVDDRVVQERDWAKRKGRSIFAMLAARQGQELARDQILEHLWPDMDSARAKNNFYVAWSSMKAALRAGAELNDSSYVDNARGRCRVVRELVRSDLDEFDELLAEARAAEGDGRTQDAASAYSQLMTVYRGELLAGDLYDDWFAAQREHYRVEFLDAMLRATQLLLDADQPSEALMFARRGLAVDPYREDLYQDALRCHIQAGQRSAAIETFLQCKAQLADELGLDPSVDTLKLYEQVLAMEERSRYDVSGLGFFD